METSLREALLRAAFVRGGLAEDQAKKPLKTSYHYSIFLLIYFAGAAAFIKVTRANTRHSYTLTCAKCVNFRTGCAELNCKIHQSSRGDSFRLQRLKQVAGSSDRVHMFYVHASSDKRYARDNGSFSEESTYRLGVRIHRCRLIASLR